MEPRVYAFDAYGTLFDVHAAVAAHRAEVGAHADALSAMWRQKQLEYSWVRALTGRYRDFWALTAEALDTAIAATGPVPADVRARLLSAYRRLSAYPEVAAVLTELRGRGATIAILSNGSPAMLASAVDAAGLGGLVDASLSVDPLRTYKTAPAAYGLVTDRFGVAPADVSFQSSNRWDIAGAHAFGFRTVWINRAGAPDEYPDLPPDRTVRSLDALLAEA